MCDLSDLEENIYYFCRDFFIEYLIAASCSKVMQEFNLKHGEAYSIIKKLQHLGYFRYCNQANSRYGSTIPTCVKVVESDC